MPSKRWEKENHERWLAYRRRWYRENADKVIAESAEKKRRLREWFDNYKSTLACIKCGENHPATLDFHHRDPTKKEISVNLAVVNGWSIERILKEIEKCDVLCSNCHRKLHYHLRE